MRDAGQTFALRFRAGPSIRVFPVTIYEAKFRGKLTKNFQNFSVPVCAATSR